MENVKIKIEEIEDSSIESVRKELINQNGIRTVNIDTATKIASIDYNPQKITRAKLKEIIERETGCWTSVPKPPKKHFIFPVGLGVFSIFLNIAFIIIIYRLIPYEASGAQPQSNPSTNLPGQNQTIQKFEITGFDHIRGNADAPITLVEFSDFECPYCAKFTPTLNKILDEFKDEVRLVYRHFPLSFHPNGEKAAEASECADEQGKFWEYHDVLFANQNTGFSVKNFKEWAKQLALDESKFNNCLDSGKYASKVETQAKEGEEKGVDGTPATFVNGQLVSGAIPFDEFKKIIENTR